MMLEVVVCRQDCRCGRFWELADLVAFGAGAAQFVHISIEYRQGYIHILDLIVENSDGLQDGILLVDRPVVPLDYIFLLRI